MLRCFVLALVLLSLMMCRMPSLAAQDDTPSAQNDSAQEKSARRAQEAETSSSKDTRVDLSPPKNDARDHPQSGSAVSDLEDAAPEDVQEFHPWDPHKAAKDIEVGDFYFKRKNFPAALDRYKEALVYKPNDAVANFRLAECQEKVGNPAEAVTHYQEYLKILPNGPFAKDAQKALERLKSSATRENTASK